MSPKEIKQLIDKDLDKALDLLDEVFEDTNGTYNSLSKKYVSRAENFSEDNFRSILKRFVQNSNRVIKGYFLSVAEDQKYAALEGHSFDDAYHLLCHLNFNHQSDYFNDYIKTDKPIIPFIIRAEEQFGQRWLFHRLIYQYQHTQKRSVHSPIPIDLNELKFDLNGLIDYLSIKLNASNYDKNQTLKKKKAKFKNAISLKLETGTQFIVLKNAFTFIHSNEFIEFYNLLDYLYTEIEALDIKGNKCIFFLVENTPESYHHSTHCICSKDVHSAIAKLQEGLKFIDLHELTPISEDDIMKWLGQLEGSLLACFSEWVNNGQWDFKKLFKTFNTGNPEEIIPFLCHKIGKNYNEHENSWLKY